ncbi:MAG: LysE family transporter [Leptolyngbya sp. SIOISBB]|nr:LysE family transporter [Leptolyngbya sp. SIOISBB]
MYFSAWMTVVAVSLVAVVTPGPDFALTLRNSLAYSRRAGLYTAIGVGAGNLVHATYSLIGIGTIIAQSILLFNLLKWLGAAYLIYLGLKSLRAQKQSVTVATGRQSHDLKRWTAFRIGVLGNLLNPKVTLFFLALFTQIVQPATPILMQVLYGLTVAVVALLWFAIVAVLISQNALKRHVLSFAHWLERLTGAALIILGCRLAIAEAND